MLLNLCCILGPYMCISIRSGCNFQIYRLIVDLNGDPLRCISADMLFNELLGSGCELCGHR